MNPYDQLATDIKNIMQIPIVPAMLDVVCRTTGMGFAAIARVTQDRWIACSVRDEIQFGLQPGSELQIKTTICNEIRDSGKAVIIDHVAEDDTFRDHHTPNLYGFQSYISVPIVLKSGEFFGTLCAIDPKPAQLNNPKIIGMFNMFSELISFHLQSLTLMERSTEAVQELNMQLTHSLDENRQYRYISNHNLQEPLRKIRLFSDMLVNAMHINEKDKVQALALKINSSAQKLSMMIKDLSDYSELSDAETNFMLTDLNKIVGDVCVQSGPQLKAKQAIVTIDTLPKIKAIPLQMEQLFFHLINNAIKFSKKEIPLVINISCTEPANELVKGQAFVEIKIADNGVGIEKSQLERIFDIFSQWPMNQSLDGGGGVGLAYCRKIIRNHGGIITAWSEPGEGTVFSMLLPAHQKLASFATA